jgi:hypothetical protein
MESSDNHSLAAKLRALTYCLARSRFSFITLVGGLTLLLMDQGRDVLITYYEDDNIFRVSVAAGFWAVSIWGWSRLLLDVHYDDLPSCLSCYNFWRTWVPGILGSLAFLVVAFSAYKVGLYAMAWSTLFLLVVFLVTVYSVLGFNTSRLAAIKGE